MDLIDRAEVHDLIAKRLSDYLTDESREELEELDIKVEEDIPTVQAVPIPDNAMNGDVIKAMFPCLEKYEYEELYTHGIALAGNDNRVTWFANDWWNAPYKGSDTEWVN